MKIFITGISGFIGSYLAEYLIKYYPNSEIFGLVRRSNDFVNTQKIKNKVKLVNGDILDYKRIDSLFKKIKPDWVFHLAAKIFPRFVKEVSEQMMEINIIGTLNLLKASKNQIPKAKIFIASSAAVYGNVRATNLPIKETCQVEPIDAYGSSKACAEILSIQYFKTFGLKIIIARTFNLLAPNRGKTFIENNFLAQIKSIRTNNTKPTILTGNLNTYRDFLDVRDTVKAYVELMKNGKSGEIYNVCSNKMISIKRILNIMLQNTGLKNTAKIIVDPLCVRSIDIKKSLGNNSKIIRQTSWRPKIPIEQSLKELLNNEKLLVG